MTRLRSLRPRLSGEEIIDEDMRRRALLAAVSLALLARCAGPWRGAGATHTSDDPDPTAISARRPDVTALKELTARLRTQATQRPSSPPASAAGL